jgi:hypothetical protein
LQNPAVGVVEGFLRSVDADQGSELDWLIFPTSAAASCRGGADFYFLSGGVVVDQAADSGDFEDFFSGQV